MDAKEQNLNVAITNTLAATSRIMDADIAKEQLEATKLQILQQTAVTQLAQANTGNQIFLKLFQ
jgi:flagellin